LEYFLNAGYSFRNVVCRFQTHRYRTAPLGNEYHCKRSDGVIWRAHNDIFCYTNNRAVVTPDANGRSNGIAYAHQIQRSLIDNDRRSIALYFGGNIPSLPHLPPHSGGEVVFGGNCNKFALSIATFSRPADPVNTAEDARNGCTRLGDCFHQSR